MKMKNKLKCIQKRYVNKIKYLTTIEQISKKWA